MGGKETWSDTHAAQKSCSQKMNCRRARGTLEDERVFAKHGHVADRWPGFEMKRQRKERAQLNWTSDRSTPDSRPTEE